MASAFTLFGELKVDTKGFDKSMRDADRTLKTTRQELEKTETSAGKMGGTFSAIAAGAAGGAVVALMDNLGRVITGIPDKFAAIVKEASEFGSKIHDAAVQTGLTAEAISALNIAAEQSGSSLEAITNSVSKFNVLLGQAEAGSAKAQAALATYGITATNSTEALKQALTAIQGLGTAQERAAATAALFKDRTGAILPVIDSFGGDLDGLMSKLDSMGLLMSQKNADAADEFGDALDTLSAQARQAGADFALEFAPDITEALGDITEFLSENKDAWKSWGEGVGQAIKGLEVLQSLLPQIGDKITGLEVAIKGGIAASGGFGILAVQIYEGIKWLGRAFGELDAKMGGSVRLLSGMFDDEADPNATSTKSVSAKLYDEIWRDEVKKRADAIKQGLNADKDAAEERIRLEKRVAAERDRTVKESIRQAKEYADTVKRMYSDAVQGYGQGINNRLQAQSLRQQAGVLMGDAPLSFQDQLDAQLRAIGGVSRYQANWVGGSPTPPGEFSDIQKRLRDQAIIQLAGNANEELSYDQKQIVAGAQLREAKALEKDAEKQSKLLDELAKAIKSGALIRIVNEAPNAAQIVKNATAAAVENRY